MNKFFKLFDIYGEDFNLRINGQSKFKSSIGGILSMITLGVLIWTVISFGSDFYLRENPKITIEDGIYPDESIPVLNGTDYSPKIIMFQYEREFDKLIRPFMTTNNSTNPISYIQHCDLNYLINNSIISGPDDFFYEYYTFYCIKLNDFHMGGLTSNQKSFNHKPLRISWFECLTLSDEEINNNNLSTCDKGYNTTENSLSAMSLSLWYQKIGFSPNSKFPFNNKLSFTNFVFTSDKMNILNIPASIYILKDDRGWISSTQDTLYDFNFLQTNLIMNPLYSNNSKFPQTYINVYVSDEYKVFKRTYSKLQDLLATIGGFMKLVLSILNIFNNLIRVYLIDYYLVNKLFDNFSQPIKMLQPTSSICVSPPITKRKSVYSSNRKSNFLSLSIKLEEEQKRGSHIKLRSVERNDKRLKESTEISKEKNGVSNERKTSIFNKSTSKEETCQSIDFYSYVKAVLHNSFNRKFDTKTLKGRRLEQIRNKIIVSDKVRDFNYILDKMNEVDNLKEILLNDHQSLCLSYLQKPREIDLGDSLHRFSNLITKEEVNKDTIQKYFLRLLNYETLTEKDEILFNRLEDKLKEKILCRISKMPTQ